MTAQIVNLTGRISSREHEFIHKRTQQGTTTVFYQLFVKIVEGGLHFSILILFFLFLFSFFIFFYFHFLFLEQLELGVEVICHTVTSVTNLIVWSQH